MLRQRLVDDYGAFIASFFQIAELRVREHVEQSLAGGLLTFSTSPSTPRSTSTGRTIATRSGMPGPSPGRSAWRTRAIS